MINIFTAWLRFLLGGIRRNPWAIFPSSMGQAFQPARPTRPDSRQESLLHHDTKLPASEKMCNSLRDI